MCAMKSSNAAQYSMSKVKLPFPLSTVAALSSWRRKGQPRQFSALSNRSSLMWTRRTPSVHRLTIGACCSVGGYPFGSFRFLTTKTSTTDGVKETLKEESVSLFLHVGPSGDCWIGRSIFAAKHNQPGYVKSVPLKPFITDAGADHSQEESEEDGTTIDDLTALGERLVNFLQEHPQQAQDIFDSEQIPLEVWKQIHDDDAD